MQVIARPALGRIACIGTLYDAKSDRFLSGSLLPEDLLEGNVSTSQEKQPRTESLRCSSFVDAAMAFPIDPETAVSILLGLVAPHGASIFLQDYARSNQRGHLGIVSHQVITVRQTLENHAQVFSSISLSTPLEMGDCTHVVTGIIWGLQTLVAVQRSSTPPSLPSPYGPDTTVDRDAFDADLDLLKSTVESINLSSSAPSPERIMDDKSITLYSDVFPDDGIEVRDQAEVLEFIRLVPAQIKQENDAKGWPLTYLLMPVAVLQFLAPQMQNIPQNPSTEVKFDILSEIIKLFDDFENAKASLLAYRDFLTRHSLHSAKRHFTDVVDAINVLEREKTSLTEVFARLIVEARSGRIDPKSILVLLDQVSQSDHSPQFVSSIAGQEQEKLEFIHDAMSRGAKYIGFNDVTMDKLDDHLELQQGDEGHYLFRFGLQSMQDETDWEDSHALLMSLLDQDPRVSIYLIDDDAVGDSGSSLPAPCISFHKAGNKVIPDVLAKNRFMNSHCLARYGDEDLDKSVRERPSKRRLVKIPCPCESCGPEEREWICPECHQHIEYGFTDSFFYCDCGRSLYGSYSFKCDDGQKHGPGYSRFREPEELHRLLRGLDQSNCVNILIMGETGVGKSTFVNAFVNYLSFSTLQEAQEADGLTSVIPCSFSLQTMDRSHPERGIQEQNIRVGTRDDEADGSAGESATQKTAVYPVTIGSKTYRLIDTPGIGDTRGASFDKKNMADILETIGNYDELHGILILLKSNNSRLTVTFRFCVQELLTHLHRSAAQAMAFGFTNTRISNYTPGDTFKPLKTLLNDFADVGLSLNTSTTYCFDSESFRYLAARKQGVEVDNEEDFRRSWDHSRKEALRLVDYFSSTSPHRVESTLSLHGTRTLISSLMTPMAQISDLVVKNLDFYGDQRRALNDTELSTVDLRRKLHIGKIQFEAKQLDRPRTVCQRKECCDFRDSGKGDGEVITIYKTHCHHECYLTNVTQDVLADPGLLHCTAFNGSNSCRMCGHNWQEHLHILYELHEVTVLVKDAEIERQLKDKADDLTLRQTAIQSLDTRIEESKAELDEIRRAAGRFWLFLRENAITPVNNATLEYLDMLIRQQKDRILAGKQNKMSVKKNEKRLELLEDERKEHLQLLETLEQNMRMPKCPEDGMLDERGVEALVQKLYKLKHFGTNLRDVKYIISTAIEGTHRERPFRVATKPSARASIRPTQDTRAHGRKDRHGQSRSTSSYARHGQRDGDEEDYRGEADGHSQGFTEEPSGSYALSKSPARGTYASAARSRGGIWGFDLARERRASQDRQNDQLWTGRAMVDWFKSHIR